MYPNVKDEINPDSPLLNTVFPSFKDAPISKFLKFIKPVKRFYFIKKQSITSGGITVTIIYLLGIPLYRSIRSSDED